VFFFVGRVGGYSKNKGFRWTIEERGISRWTTSSKEVVMTNQRIGQDRVLVQAADSRGDIFWDKLESGE